MGENFLGSQSEICLDFIHSKFQDYEKILNDDQKACDNIITSIRQKACLYVDDDDETFQSKTGFDRIQLVNQLDYYEEEAFKTNEENKTCLFKMFQNLFNLHRQCAYDEVFISEQRIAESFQYRPSVLSNIAKLRFPTYGKQSSSSIHSDLKHSENLHRTSNVLLSIPSSSASFSNRADIHAFQQNKSSVLSKVVQPIDDSEIDLTKLIRETDTNRTSDGFKFSKISQHLQQQKQKQKPNQISSKKMSKQSTPCNDALLVAANKRYILLYNMNMSNKLYISDTQNNETKEIPWDEGDILSLGHVDTSIFYTITSTKIFLYDIIREHITSQYFLYDTLYKDLLLIASDSSYRTLLKRNNQIQSTVYDDFCYYLYTNKEYNQIFVKCLLDGFFQESNINLTKLYPDIQYFLGFTITPKSLITFLIHDSNKYQLIFCDESKNYNILIRIPIENSICPTSIITTYLYKIKHNTLNKNKTSKYGKQIWFILDTQRNCIDCYTQEIYLTTIEPTKNNQIQSMSIFEEKLIVAYNELSVKIIDLDNYFSLFEV